MASASPTPCPPTSPAHAPLQRASLAASRFASHILTLSSPYRLRPSLRRVNLQTPPAPPSSLEPPLDSMTACAAAASPTCLQAWGSASNRWQSLHVVDWMWHQHHAVHILLPLPYSELLCAPSRSQQPLKPSQ
ncbi:hypothetical protein L7F22_003530, partial [Adiantum nelumboides]|nr:hypothetical protein [Adiantum nelumboides]